MRFCIATSYYRTEKRRWQSRRHQRATIDVADKKFRELLQSKTGRPPAFEQFEFDIALMLVEAGKPKDLLNEVYADSPFKFLTNLKQVADLDRRYVVDTLNKLLQSKSLTALQAVMLSINAGVDSDFADLAQQAFNEAVDEIGRIEQSELREHPEYKQRHVDRPLRILSLLTESRDFRADVAKLKAAVQALGLVPARGLGVDVDLLQGSVHIRGKEPYAKLARTLLPDVAAAIITATGCAEGRVYDELVASDQLKQLVWSAVLD